MQFLSLFLFPFLQSIEMPHATPGKFEIYTTLRHSYSPLSISVIVCLNADSVTSKKQEEVESSTWWHYLSSTSFTSSFSFYSFVSFSFLSLYPHLSPPVTKSWRLFISPSYLVPRIPFPFTSLSAVRCYRCHCHCCRCLLGPCQVSDGMFALSSACSPSPRRKKALDQIRLKNKNK
jgi:hypothetical protein